MFRASFFLLQTCMDAHGNIYGVILHNDSAGLLLLRMKAAWALGLKDLNCSVSLLYV